LIKEVGFEDYSFSSVQGFLAVDVEIGPALHHFPLFGGLVHCAQSRELGTWI